MSISSKKLVLASDPHGLKKVVCESCDQQLVTSDLYCGSCGDSIPVTAGDSLQLTASVMERMEACYSCGDCSTILYSTTKDPGRLANYIMCTACGSPDLRLIASEDDEEEKETSDDDSSDEEEEEEETSDDDSSDEEEETESEPEPKPNDKEEIEAAWLSNPRPNWTIFQANGDPMFRLYKHKQPKDCQINAFCSDSFPDIFMKRVNETSLFAAAEEFNAEYCVKGQDIVSHADIEKTVRERIHATVIPRLLECTSLATKGMVRGFWTKLNYKMKASMSDEMLAHGVSSEDASQIVASTFESCGHELFMAIIAKGIELYNMKDDVYQEIEKTILDVDKITPIAGSSSATVSEDDIEAIVTEHKLTAGSVPVDVSAYQKSAYNDVANIFQLGSQ
jgi:Zn finger protein HypA/HybF involved in hydrogenase expression